MPCPPCEKSTQLVPLQEWSCGLWFEDIDTSFPKLSFSLESLQFAVGNKYCPLFSSKWQDGFVYFQENVCQKTTLCVSFMQDGHHTVSCITTVLFCVLLTLWPETCERVCTQGRRCNTDYSCYCSIKDIHRLNSVTVRVWQWVSQQLLVICWCHCLGLCWNTGSFALCQYKCQRHEKGHVSLIKIALFSGHPHRACFENCYYIHALFTNHGLTAVAF